jgi:hypothetical protein
MLLADLPESCIREIHETTRTVYRGFKITYIPRKVFAVQDLTAPRRWCRIEDVFGFFGSSFVAAYEGFLDEPVSETTRAGKLVRADMGSLDLDDVVAYNRIETKEIAKLATAVRSRLHTAGIGVRKLHGPGAVAEYVLSGLKADRWMDPHEDLELAAAGAYFGGRIDVGRIGEISGPIYDYDLRSAYPWAMRDCLDLSRVRWIASSSWSGDLYSLVRIRWDSPEPRRLSRPWWGPLPWRSAQGAVLWPASGEGWYHGVEVLAAMQAHPRVRWTVVEAWNLSADSEVRRPFAPYVGSLYERRMRLDRQKGWPIKLALNSLYGKTAQSVGRRRFTSSLWAGWITAACRARLSEAIAAGEVVLTMTDAVYSTTPLPDDMLSEGLGGWDHAATFDRLWIAQPGVSVAERDGSLVAVTTRGFPRMDAEDLRDKIVALTDEPPETYVTFSHRQYVTAGLAIAWNDLGRWRSWVEMDRKLRSPVVFGTSKRLGAWGSRRLTIPRPWPGGLSSPYDPMIRDDEIEEVEGDFTDPSLSF